MEKNGIKKRFIYYDDYSTWLYFEVKIVNGEITGKGKEYDIIGKVVFEGKFLNNGYKGNGKGYDKNCCMILELEDEKGKGKIYNIYSIISYEGEFLDRKKIKKEKNFMVIVL